MNPSASQEPGFAYRLAFGKAVIALWSAPSSRTSTAPGLAWGLRRETFQIEQAISGYRSLIARAGDH
jgi:hypothetical protein